jgi:hypothetical protein
METEMAGIVILNAVLAVLVVAALVGLCTRAILADARHRRSESEARLAATGPPARYEAPVRARPVRERRAVRPLVDPAA